MSALDKLFIKRQIRCPACRREVLLEYPNPRNYVVATRESDLHPTSYRWIGGEEVDLKPHYYFVWQCPFCYFAELTEKLESPKESVKDLYLKEAWEGIDPDKFQVLEAFRQLVPEGEMDFDGAAVLHLSAILITTLPEKQRIDHNKLGRLTLRLGWLFRERSMQETEPVIKGGTIGRLRNDLERLEHQSVVLAEVIGDAKRSAAARDEELASQAGEAQSPYLSILDSLSDKLDEMNTLILMIQRASLHDSDGDLEFLEASLEPEEGELDTVLSKLRARWPTLPFNEEMCLRMAVDAYNYSYSNESAFQSIEQGMTIIRLIVDLLMRVKDYERSLLYIHQFYKVGMNNKVELRRRINTGRRTQKLTIHDESLLKRKIAHIDHAIREAGETRRYLLEILVKQYMPKIEEVLSKNMGATQRDRERALTKAKIPEELIPEIRRRKLFEKDFSKG